MTVHVTMAHPPTPLRPSPSPSSLASPSSGFKRAAPDSRDEPVHAVSGRPWSQEELTVLTRNQQLGHTGQWKALSEHLPGRSADACRRKYKTLFPASHLESDPIVRSVRLYSVDASLANQRVENSALTAPPASSSSVAHPSTIPPSQTSPEHHASHIMHDDSTTTNTLASVAAPVRSPVTPVADALPRTERLHVLTASERTPVNGEPSSDLRQAQSAKEQIGELYIQVVTVEQQQGSRRSQIQSMEAEVARLHQQLDSQRQELIEADERVRLLRTQMDLLADQVTRGKS